MSYLKPPLFTRRVFNPLAKRFGIAGAVELVIPRRRTGEAQSIPVIPVEHDGARYLVSTRGESDWVRNLRAAAGSGELRRKGTAEPFLATEIPVAERPPIIAAYRAVAGKTVEAYWKKLPDPADHPVFGSSGRPTRRPGRGPRTARRARGVASRAAGSVLR